MIQPKRLRLSSEAKTDIWRRWDFNPRESGYKDTRRIGKEWFDALQRSGTQERMGAVAPTAKVGTSPRVATCTGCGASDPTHSDQRRKQRNRLSGSAHRWRRPLCLQPKDRNGGGRRNAGYCRHLEEELGLVARGVRHFVYRFAFLFHGKQKSG